MNGYMRALKHVTSAHAADSETAPRATPHELMQRIRAMSHPREIDRRTDEDTHADNVITLRVDRTPTKADALACDATTIDATISFVLNVLFDGNRSKAEIRIARALFRPGASIVLIPRDRPSLACAVGVDEFFTAEKEMLRYEENWEEAWRMHDPSAHAASRMRVCSHILLDPKLETARPRSTEVVFSLRNVSNAQRIHSCTIVYDEAAQGSSPATLFA
jgi:hypothetical protein